jgi:hypothetical protein
VFWYLHPTPPNPALEPPPPNVPDQKDPMIDRKESSACVQKPAWKISYQYAYASRACSCHCFEGSHDGYSNADNSHFLVFFFFFFFSPPLHHSLTAL